MNDMFLYMVNIITVVLLVSSAAGSVLFLFMKIATDAFSGRYEVRFHYLVMRLAVFFYLLPAVVITVWIIISRTCWEMIGYQPPDRAEKVDFLDYFGILVISEHSLNVARVAVFAVWLAGAAAFFIFRLAYEMRALGTIKKHSIEWDTETIRKMRRRIMMETGTQKQIRIYKSSMTGTPFSAGIIHQAIYFPQTELCGDDLYRILKHEYIHCIRNDILYRLFMMMIRGIHWYHPLIYFFEREFFHCSELACDEEVLKEADTQERYCYAQLVLSMLEAGMEEGQTVYGAGFISSSEAEMKRRILHIMKGRKKAARAVILAGMIFFALFCPVSTFAASRAVAAFGSHIVKAAKGMAALEVVMEEYLHKEVFNGPDHEVLDVKGVPVLAAGTGLAEAAVTDAGAVCLFRMALDQGDTLTFGLACDNGDAFTVGLEDLMRNRTKYVESNKGKCEFTFSENKKSEYVFFVKTNSDTEGESIHITGDIIVQ